MDVKYSQLTHNSRRNQLKLATFRVPSQQLKMTDTDKLIRECVGRKNDVAFSFVAVIYHSLLNAITSTTECF